MEASSSNRVALTCSALGLDGGVEFLFLGLQGVHGLGGARVEYALGDRLDEVGKLGLYVRAACLQSLEDLVPAPVGLLVVVREVDRERGQHFELSEEGLNDLLDACLDLVLAHCLRRALLLALVEAVVVWPTLNKIAFQEAYSGGGFEDMK